MAAAISPFFRDTSFDPFLFSEIGEERNGMLLSMVSALARLDLDPWREAASLSRLPASAATERLTSLLTSMPGTQIEAPAPATILRLIRLLPKAAPDEVWTRGAVVSARSNLYWPIAGLLVLALLAIVGQQWTLRRGAEPTNGAAAPVSSAPQPGAGEARGK
jgi:hypothetical protein